MNSPEDAPDAAAKPKPITDEDALAMLSLEELTMQQTIRYRTGETPLTMQDTIRFQRPEAAALTNMDTIRYSADGKQATAPQRPITTQHPAEGTVVFKRYCLQRILGRGGMGVVWLAFDMKLERTVALKFLPDAIGTDHEALSELKEETKRGLDLAHPNIIRIYDFVDDDTAAAISMEFVDGPSLAEMRASRPNKIFTTEELGPWVKHLCDALEYAHVQRQIVHRDLKPANLMIDASNQLKIADFGIAASIGDSLNRVGNGTTSGTLYYMSPQQSMGGDPSATDDIYSLGATLYDLLTGKPPFYRGDVSLQIATKEAVRMAQRREELEIKAEDNIPKEWEDAIAACLDKDPMCRPQTAGELAARLGLGGGDGKPIIVMVKGDEVRVPWLTKKQTIAASAAALAVILPLSSWLWTHRSGHMIVETNPPEAMVSLNENTQHSPARFDHLKPGDYQAVMLLEGFEPHPIEFTVHAGEEVNLGTIKLFPQTNVALGSPNEEFTVTGINATIVPPQPNVTPPPGSFWNIDEIFQHSEYSRYSENGRHYIMREAQNVLKESGSYKGEINGEASPELQQGLQKFQGLHELKPTGLLDAMTIMALEISLLPDKANWNLKAEQDDKLGWWEKNVSRPVKRLFGSKE